ncbi:MAG: DUF5107 domain-containing protein [Lachnospiraceae bacterium]|nr:DUF5107 domain-containing protein [Lachnospiraceae bacterium]
MITRETITIPTYAMRAAESEPVYYEYRNHQNARGNMYPLPMIDRFTDDIVDKTYDAIKLENDYIRLIILPELGGRIYEGYDKGKNYHFIYKNNVIKPAMIGIAGAWISGGLEFNWPQHHRPTTFMKVDSWISRNEDGSETAWIGEYEPLTGLKQTSGITIWPDKSYFTVKTKIYNPTPITQTFHWWANLAVHSNDNYQLQFPPDIDYITYHNKNVISKFPIVNGDFATAHFDRPTDITWAKNIPEQASFFILNSHYDFMGGYDHGRKRGSVNIGDHNVSLGKKFFTWGQSDLGKSWFRNLTDHDGEYLEIMTGCYTDNQPDFTFIVPEESKEFEQSWYATMDMPDLKNAEKDGAVGFSYDTAEKAYIFHLNVTSAQKDCHLIIKMKGKTRASRVLSLTPSDSWTEKVEMDESISAKDIEVLLTSAAGKTIVSYQYTAPYYEGKEPPKPHKASRMPKDISTQDDLYLEGLHVEQYRNITLRAEDYYSEALQRDPSDYRCSNAMGLLLMRRTDTEAAQQYFERALESVTQRNQNPRDGEYSYNLAWALEENGNEKAAVDYYRKSAWNLNFKAAALKQAARLYIRRKDYETALSCLSEAYDVNRKSVDLTFLKIFTERHITGTEELSCEMKTSYLDAFLKTDPIDYVLRAEKWFCSGREEELTELKSVIGVNRKSWVLLISRYIDISAYNETLQLVKQAPKDPMVCYYAEYAADMLGKAADAENYAKEAASMPLDYCFPYTDWDKKVLLHDISCNRIANGTSHYLLACLFYGREDRKKAETFLEEAIIKNPELYQAHRLMALAQMDVEDNGPAALEEMKKAVSGIINCRYLLEYVQILRFNNIPPEQILPVMAKHQDIVNELDSLAQVQLDLLNEAEIPDDTIKMLNTREFHPFEGGEGALLNAHILAYVEKALTKIKEKDYRNALSLLNESLAFRDNYHQGIGRNVRMSPIYYLKGSVYEKLRDQEKADAEFKKAAGERTGYLDQGDFFTVCALVKANKPAQASLVAERMLRESESILADVKHVPYFDRSISSLPGEDDIVRHNEVKGHRGKAFALMLLGKRKQAAEEVAEVKEWHGLTEWLKIAQMKGDRY